MTENRNALRSRWSHEDRCRIGDYLVTGRCCIPSFESVFADHNGRIDLRGVVLDRFIKEVKLEYVDFSFITTELAGQFGMSTLTNCRFVGADLRTNLGSHFVECDFSRAKLQRAVLRGKFDHCIFDNANISGALANGTRFVGCSFNKANLSKAAFYNCIYDSCSFEGSVFQGGSLAGSRFIGSWPNEDILHNTIMERVSFD